MVRNLSIAAVMVIALATFAACSGGSGGGGISPPNLNMGVLGGPCFADGTCNEGLVCEQSVCVEPIPGGPDSECQDDSNCSDNLVCIDGVCTAVERKLISVPDIGRIGGDLSNIPCIAGTKGCECREGGVCSDSLVCTEGVCATATLERKTVSVPDIGRIGGDLSNISCIAGTKGCECREGGECNEGLVCKDDACAALPSPMTSAKLTIITGDVKGAATDADVYFRLCKASSKPPSFDSTGSEAYDKWVKSNCTAKIDLGKQKGDNFEVGDTDVFSTAAGDFSVDGLTDEYKTFSLCLAAFHDPSSEWNTDYNIEDWFIQSVRLELTFKNGTTYTYFNPIWQENVSDSWGGWFASETFIYPDDIVVGAIVGTGDMKRASTDDNVFLRLKGDEGLALFLPAVYWTCSYDVSYDACMVDYIVRRDYNNFERGMVTAYGVEVNAKPGTVPFRIEKEIDGKKGAWFLDSLEIFHFEPGKFLNDPTSKVYHKKVEVKEWIENDLGLTWPRNDGWIELDEASPDIITNEIGNHY